MNRESLYDISWQVPESTYRSSKAKSYSTLSRFNREGFSGLSTLYDSLESPSLLFGNLVDTLCTGDLSEYKSKYLVSEFPSTPDNVVLITKKVFEEYKDRCTSLKNIPDNELYTYIEECNYQSNWKPETRVKVVKEKGEEYYKLLFLSKDKTIVSTKDHQDAVKCVKELQENPFTSFYFAPNNPFDTNIERFYQLKFKAEYCGIPLRCMFDLLLVNHEEKIILPVDLKTTSKKEWEFYKSFIQWNYWIQAQLYWWILKQNLSNHPLYKDYTIADYRFIVISRYTLKPIVWEYTDTKTEVDVSYGKNNQYVCRNWRGILIDLEYYEKENPQYPKGITTKNDIKKWLNNE